MRRTDLDLIAVGVAALAAALAVLLIPDSSAAAAAGLPLALLLPGYALLAAAFPGPGPSRAERGVWSVGLSAVAVVLVGLVLDRVASLERVPWAIGLAGLTLAGAAVALARRARLASGEPAVAGPRPVVPRPTAPQAAAALLAVAAVAGVVAISRASEQAVPRPAFSELWLVRAADPGEPGWGLLGVRSHESEPVGYRVLLRHAGRNVASWRFRLAPGEAWERTVRAPAGVRVTARLYRVGGPLPYRRAVLAVPVDARPAAGPSA